MRRAERALFGHADNDGASKSLVRLRLSKWDGGKETHWSPLQKVTHPEVRNKQGQTVPVGSDLYLGFGPLEYRNGATHLKKNAAIQAGEFATLSLAWPEEADVLLIDQALWLIDRYGTLGGRSRNGWGSFSLTPANGEAKNGTLSQRNWQDCLQLDWPHAIGKDEQGALIWQTNEFDNWKLAMTELAKLKIALRTKKFPYTQSNDRNWLAQPVTHHTAGSLRLPNSLRFKLRPTPDGKLVCVVFHVPCQPPRAFSPSLTQIEGVWKTVHQFLDDPNNGLRRVQE
jgi:CRISPR-associated protein Cmr1